MTNRGTSRKGSARAHVPEERLSRAEWPIMRICWRLGRATVHEILRESLEIAVRDYTTIQTYLKRMARKGYLEIDRDVYPHMYEPAVEREPVVRAEIEHFFAEVIGTETPNLALLRDVLDEQEAGTDDRS